MITIEIENRRYYILSDGTKLPSITTILGSLEDNQRLIAWENAVGTEEADRQRGLATRKGTTLHSLIEEYLGNGILPGDMMPNIQELFRQFLKSRHLIQKVYLQEEALYSVRLGIAGRVDCVCQWNNIDSILDFKTSNYSKTEEEIHKYFIQSTAYALMYSEMFKTKITQIVIMIMVPGLKEPQIFVKNPKDYISGLIEKRNQFNEKFPI